MWPQADKSWHESLQYKMATYPENLHGHLQWSVNVDTVGTDKRLNVSILLSVGIAHFPNIAAISNLEEAKRSTGGYNISETVHQTLQARSRQPLAIATLLH